jgi:hypothetical protein
VNVHQPEPSSNTLTLATSRPVQMVDN